MVKKHRSPDWFRPLVKRMEDLKKLPDCPSEFISVLTSRQEWSLRSFSILLYEMLADAQQEELAPAIIDMVAPQRLRDEAKQLYEKVPEFYEGINAMMEDDGHLVQHEPWIV